MRSNLTTPPPPPEPPIVTDFIADRITQARLQGALDAKRRLSEESNRLAEPPPPPEPVTVEGYDASTAEDEAAAVILAILSGTGPLSARLTSRAFILTVLGIVPSILAGIGQLRQLLPPQFALPIYGATFLLTALYVAFSRWENASTARSAAQVAAARFLAAPTEPR